MSNRMNISGHGKWEPIAGYSRAVRVGPFVYVSGTTATDERGQVVGLGDPAKQTAQALSNIEKALTEAGARMSDVVRTRIYVTNIDLWEKIGRAHAAAFGEVRPTTSMIEVSRLVEPSMLVEIEAEAVIGKEIEALHRLLEAGRHGG
ncbi:MAG: RidA family protein [Thermoanaerobaculia bacterium]|nr:RidA family protein [Thermoanaerobaculia bacterium]